MGERIPKWFSNNLSLKVWSLLIALFLWFHVTTERVVEESFRIPLRTYGVPENLVILSVPPDYLEAKIRGKGKQILRLRLSEALVAKVDLSKARRGEVGFKISPGMVALPAWTTARVSEIVEPKELRLDFDREARKAVEVIAATGGVPREGYTQVGSLTVDPAKVTLIGARLDVRAIEALEAEPIDISGLSKTLTGKVRVLLPQEYGLSCEPESVVVTVSIEELIERTFAGVAIKVLNSPKTEIELDPPSIKLVLRGPQHRMKELKAEEISVTIDLKEHPSGGDSLPVTIRPPDGISLVSAEPELFKVKW